MCEFDRLKWNQKLQCDSSDKNRSKLFVNCPKIFRTKRVMILSIRNYYQLIPNIETLILFRQIQLKIPTLNTLIAI